MNKYLLALLIPIFLLVGCARWQNRRVVINDKRLVSKAVRDTENARRLHEKALVSLCDCEDCEAETLVRDALICDSEFGPAHNTLGRIYFDKGKLYLAAWEFETASQLLPNHGEPLNNLGLVYEQVNQPEKALEYFQQAMACEEDNAEYLGNYLRTRLRRGDKTPDLVPMLERLIVIENRPEWRDWAKEQLVIGDMKDLKNESIPVELAPGEILIDGPRNFGTSDKIEPLNVEGAGRENNTESYFKDSSQ